MIDGEIEELLDDDEENATKSKNVTQKLRKECSLGVFAKFSGSSLKRSTLNAAINFYEHWKLKFEHEMIRPSA